MDFESLDSIPFPDFEHLIGAAPLPLGAVPSAPRSTTSWDAVLIGYGAAECVDLGSLQGLTHYNGRYAAGDGDFDDLVLTPFFRVLGAFAVRRAVAFWFFGVPPPRPLSAVATSLRPGLKL